MLVVAPALALLADDIRLAGLRGSAVRRCQATPTAPLEEPDTCSVRTPQHALQARRFLDARPRLVNKPRINMDNWITARDSCGISRNNALPHIVLTSYGLY